MSFNEVKNLRKSGDIERALEMALENYTQNSNDIWNKRALAWVYYDFTKKYAQENNVELFLETIHKIKELELPSEEKMIFDNLIWAYNTLFRHIYSQKIINYTEAKRVKESLLGLHFSFPSENFSRLIGALHKTFKDESSYASLAEKSFFNYLRPEDFLPTEYNGRKIMPLAEQIYISYCKALIKGESSMLINNGFLNVKYPPNKQRIADFLPNLNKIIETNPNYTFLPYFKAKMEIILGEENALQTFIPFAKKKKNDYWVWQLMSEIIKDDETEFACLCKALSLRSPEQFLGKIRQLLAERLIKKHFFNEARTEIDLIIAEKTKNEQKIPNQILLWKEQDWYQKAANLGTNIKLYNQYKSLADKILYDDIEERIVVVQSVNEDKKILNFIQSREKSGFFKYQNFLKNPKVGDILKVRLEEKENGFCKLITAKIDNESISECVKSFNGKISIFPQGFGFVNDVFLASYLLQENKIMNGEFISGKSILSFDKKKNKWGWQAFSISKLKLNFLNIKLV